MTGSPTRRHALSGAAAGVLASLAGIPLLCEEAQPGRRALADVTLRQGKNTVTVTATINGSTYTDSVDWTLG